METYQGVDAFIEVLNANGVEHIFFNPGGDICPLQVALLKYRVSGKPSPQLRMCLHESVAMSAAHGHYMVSGKPQVVMVHSELGTQQVGGAVHNAQWGRIPVVLMAGLAAGPQRVNWRGEQYDQGTMVRNCVKWDHTIGPDEDLHEAFQRGFDIAMTEPRGPVYLSYARDAFVRNIMPRRPEDYRSSPASLPNSDGAALEKIANTMISARNPLIVPGYTGRYPETIRSLVDLAEMLGASVMPGLTRMNFPTTHPLCAGMEEMGGGAKANIALTEADVVLAVDYDLPYVPAEGMPKPDATLLHIDVDPLTQGRSLWGRGAAVFLKADSREVLPALVRIIREKVNAQNRDEFRARGERLRSEYQRRREDRKAVAIDRASAKPIHPDWVAYCLNRVLDEDAILVNHLISQSSSIAAQIDRSNPFTLLACAGGSINWALGAALGAKVGAPEKTVVSVLTDGGFVWGCPVATLWSATSLGAPFLSVVFNNQSYGAIRSIVERMSESRLSDEQGYFCGVDISPPPDYALVARTCGGFGKRVEDPDEVLSSLKEGLRAVGAGKVAVVDVRLAKG